MLLSIATKDKDSRVEDGMLWSERSNHLERVMRADVQGQ